MFCPKCGEPIEEGTVFCPKCGKKILENDNQQTVLSKIQPATVKKTSPIIFGIIILCFFLPWINVSCSNQPVITLSGMQLVTGTTMRSPITDKKETTGNSLYAIIALLSAIVGLFLGFSKQKKVMRNSIWAGIVGIVSLILFVHEIDNVIVEKGGGMLQLHYKIGFYLTFFLFILVTAFNIFFNKINKPTLPITDNMDKKEDATSKVNNIPKGDSFS